MSGVVERPQPGAETVTVHGTRRARLPVNLLLALGSLLVGLAALTVAEQALRAFDPRYLDRTRGECVYSETLGWRLRPGFQGLVHDTWTTVDGRGHRGQLNEGSRIGRVRVVVLGDSIAFGHRVRDEQVFCALLARRTGRFDVWNLAVEGYGTDQELLVLQDEGVRLRPDHVVLSFCSNDVVNNALDRDHQDGRTPKPYFELTSGGIALRDEHVRLTRARRLSQWLADQSQLYGRIGDRLAILHQPPRGSEPPAVVPARLDRREAIELTVQLVRRIADLVRASGAQFLLLLQADEPGLLERSWLSIRVRSSPLLAGVRAIDMGERFRARGLSRKEVLLDYQGHLTPLGHEVVAQELEIALATRQARGSGDASLSGRARFPSAPRKGHPSR
jgi:hypothetical protein